MTDQPLTTKQLRTQPLLIVNTGEGKGKTTAACGIALRAWAQGWRLGVFQFLKSGKWRVGEEQALRTLGQIHTETGQGGPVVWEHMGLGWSWLGKDPDSSEVADKHVDAAQQGWEHVRAALADERFDLYLLDEFTYAMANGWVDTEEVVQTLRDRPGHQHVVITGRRAPTTLIDAADLVTEMTKIKHPFDQGRPGQKGIEW